MSEKDNDDLFIEDLKESAGRLKNIMKTYDMLLKRMDSILEENDKRINMIEERRKKREETFKKEAYQCAK